MKNREFVVLIKGKLNDAKSKDVAVFSQIFTRISVSKTLCCAFMLWDKSNWNQEALLAWRRSAVTNDLRDFV